MINFFKQLKRKRRAKVLHEHLLSEFGNKEFYSIDEVQTCLETSGIGPISPIFHDGDYYLFALYCSRNVFEVYQRMVRSEHNYFQVLGSNELTELLQKKALRITEYKNSFAYALVGASEELAPSREPGETLKGK